MKKMTMALALSVMTGIGIQSAAQASTFGMPLVVQTLVAAGITTKEVVEHNIMVYRLRTQEMLSHIQLLQKGRNVKASRASIRALLAQSRNSLAVQTEGLSDYIPTDLSAQLDATEAALNRSDYKGMRDGVIAALVELNEVGAALRE